MSILKSVSMAAGVGAIALAAAYFQTCSAAEEAASVQTQQPRAQATQAPVRRTTRSYSYSPNRGLDPGPNTPTWKRADSKVKFRYGYYPY